ncbi:Os10g0388500 [Oryza sativa Japonica Group]|uniref:Expressed protein n=2 Tax=Oryza sativa subsp. japonica TaxID=39947 RepID=Q338Q5_ORYSJ|nr:expressed protein [Oryza sativa Japonica Group]BAT10646.1 Os10g0388500 [Oryza sativa Japonica Group]
MHLASAEFFLALIRIWQETNVHACLNHWELSCDGIKYFSSACLNHWERIIILIFASNFQFKIVCLDNNGGSSVPTSSTRSGPFADITNVIDANLTNNHPAANKNGTNVPKDRENCQHNNLDSTDVTKLSATKLKRKRAREWYASLTKEQKEDRNKKARDIRKRRNFESQDNGSQAATSKKITTTASSVSAPFGDIKIASTEDQSVGGRLDVNDAGTENVGSIVTPVRLPFTNSSDMSYSTPSEYTMPLQAEDAHGDVTNLSASELKNKRSREWYASLTKEQKEDRNRKARDARRRRKDESQGNVPKATTSKFSTPTPTLGDISIVTAGDPAGREQWVSNDELLDTPTTKGTG